MRTFPFVLSALCVATLLSAGCASTSSGKESGDAEGKAGSASVGAEGALRPAFGWKPGWTFKVRREALEKTTKANGDEVLEKVRMDFRARVTGYEKDALILTYDQYENLEVDTPDEKMTWADLSREDQETLNTTYTKATPALVVATDGQFRHALRAEGALDFIRDLAEEDELTEEKKTTMDRLLTADVIQAAAKNEWAIQVELWTQRDYPPGQMFRSEFQGPHPMAPGVLVKNIMTFGLEKTLPCPKNEGRQCGAFVMIMETDPASMERVMDAMLKDYAPKNSDGSPKGDFQLKSIQNRITHTLVAEMATLQPYVQRKVTEVMVDAVEGGKDAKTTKHSEMTTAYFLQTP
jgi:hypothetical protein